MAGKFVNIHILHTLPFANPNRDDTGAPKSCLFGGTTRSRLSSQSLKRAARQWFEGESGADLTWRSKHNADQLTKLAIEILEGNGQTVDDAERDRLLKAAKTKVKVLTGKAEEARETLVWIAEDEARKAAQQLARKHAEPALDLDDVLSGRTESLTIAGFGRMFANRPELQLEAAVQVAHAFTTHAQQIDLDYFTAVDDLTRSFDPEAGAGAGHLDIAEFTSGVYYRFLSIDTAQLRHGWEPLGDGTRSDEVLGRLATWLRALVEMLPSGKENVAAHHTIPSYVMVTFGDRPLSYAPAFENAVSADKADAGFLRPSVDRLADYAARVARATGLDTSDRIVFDLDVDGSATLDDLYRSVASRIAGTGR